MPLDDAASCYLASPRMNYVSGSDLGKLPYDVETTNMRYALILANLRREGPIPAYVAVIDYELYNRSFY